MHMQHMAKVVKTNKLLHEELESSRALIDTLLLQLKATKKMQNSAETIGINVTKLNADFACVKANQESIKASQIEITRMLAILLQEE